MEPSPVRMSERPVALVTGAAQRIGRAIALELAAHGWDVAIHYRLSQKEAEATVADARALGVRAASLAADLADEDACRALVPQVVARFGRVDSLVNSASLFEYDNTASFSTAAMLRHSSANAAAPVLLAQALSVHVRSRHAEGCVVNLLDQKLWNPNPDHFSYTLSKAALQSATTLLAQALAPQVRVCGVAPGLTLGSSLIDPDALEALERMQPLLRLPAIDDIARAVRFMMECRSITGATLLVDAGQHLVREPRDFAFLVPRATQTPGA